MNPRIATPTLTASAFVLPPSIDPLAAKHVCRRFVIPGRAVTDLICLSAEELRERDRFIAMSNQMEPADFPRFALGSAKIAAHHRLAWVSKPGNGQSTEIRGCTFGVCGRALSVHLPRRARAALFFWGGAGLCW